MMHNRIVNMLAVAGMAMSSAQASTRVITRRTFPSTAGSGRPKEIDAMEPAV